MLSTTKDLRAGRLRDQSARRRSTGRLPAVPGADDQAHAAGRRRTGAGPEGGRPLPQLLRDGPGVLALRPRWSRRCGSSTTSSASRPTWPRPTVGALQAGWNYGETTDAFASSYPRRTGQAAAGQVPQHHGQPGAGLGLDGGRQASGKELFYGTYPITPASDILHELSKYKNFGVRTFQAEDEIAAICAAIGAAFGGAMGVTASSGPGIALKGEAMGLA